MVDLPAPLGPVQASRSPGSAVNDRSASVALERVRVGEAQPQDGVGDHEQRHEEHRVGERRRRDDVRAGDVDGGEASRREEADERKVDELPVANAQR